MKRWARAIWFAPVGFLLLVTLPALGLQVEQFSWGFAGHVVPGRFNLLSVLVTNPEKTTFDGTVKFFKYRGLSERAGAIYAAPCYLSPGMSRWLQFYVYIDNQYDQWRVEWGRDPRDSREIDQPKWGAPAVVVLSDDPVNSAFKQFPENLFPPTVSATSGLEAVVLDHMPRWESTRRQAFLDWLRSGGRVHLAENSLGQRIVFTEDLALLNSPEDQFAIGAGKVIRHAKSIKELKSSDIATEKNWRQYQSGEYLAISQTSDLFRRGLTQISQRQYNWDALYALAFVYALLIGPGVFLMGRRWMDYRLRIALLLATIAGFAVLFNYVGRRGQGETSSVHTLTYANSLGDGRYDVMQWSSVFAAHGAQYVLKHPAPHNLYGTDQDYEAVNGVIESVQGGHFAVDIPMFSQRPFLHAAEMTGPDVPVTVNDWNISKDSPAMEISVKPEFLAQIRDAWLLHDNHVYKMKMAKASMSPDPVTKQSVWEFISEHRYVSWDSQNYSRTRTPSTPAPDPYRKFAEPMIVWRLGLADYNSTNNPAGDVHTAQLFVFANNLSHFKLSTADLGYETCQVLYEFHLSEPASHTQP